MKRRFDVAVVVPLDEEFEIVVSHFKFVENVSTPTRVRFEMSAADSELKILFVKQNIMGKTECANATLDIIEEFEIGLLICLGIAGGLSGDVCIGDVCRTGEIVDLLDNAKVSDTSRPKKTSATRRASRKSPATGHQVSFSPTHYETPTTVSVALDLDKFAPERKESFNLWASERMEFGRNQIPDEFRGKDGRKEWITAPNIRSGLIACAAVSGSSDYNKNIKKLDRKILAIETESGGLFSIAKRSRIPALTIRGISDYAGFGVDKNEFERETNNKARLVAASNAASYLARQMSNPRLSELLLKPSDALGQENIYSAQSPSEQLANTIVAQSNDFDHRLKELSPAFSLQNEGYRIPVPRVLLTNGKLDPVLGSSEEPVELREAIKQGRVIIVEVPPQYPDRSLAWIVARDLLRSQIAEKQVVPTVIEASDLHRPGHGITAASDPRIVSLNDAPNVQVVFIINEFNFQSRTQTQFLLDEINAFPNAKSIILTRNRSNIISENVFARKTGALIARLDDISFVEVSHFLQKNFEMPSSEAEVIAVRLHETFSKFKLSAHPSYFAGIPVATLAALLRANRRAELIELAVAGYLSYVVAEDNEPVTLSRTTREKFLTQLAFEIKFRKRLLSESDLVEMISQFARKYDFKISALRFFNSFVEKGILYVDDERVHFTLPFMETYLLAKRLHQEPSLASEYFQLGIGTFDLPTFTIYAELGLSDKFIETLSKRLTESVDRMQAMVEEPSILLTNQIQPILLSKQDRIRGMQARLQKAIADVTDDNDASQEKQRLIDAADRVRRAASRQSQQALENDEEEARRTVEQDAVEIWFVSASLLGAGAERLDAETKRSLVGKTLKLTALILNDWTNAAAKVDFKKIKSDLLSDDELVFGLSKSDTNADLAEAKRTLDGLVDILEYSLVSQPFRAMIQGLCEEARDGILAESVVNTQVDGVLENLLKNIWLSDLDTSVGVKELTGSIKQLTGATFLRVTLAAHLISRVYWRHWDRESRLKLLKAAQESIKVSGVAYDKAGIQRLIAREEKS